MLSLEGFQSVKTCAQTYKSHLYEAVRESDHSPVIIKVLKCPYPESFDMLVFRQLTERLKESEHPGLLRILTLSDASSSIAIVYEGFSGTPLKNMLSRGALDPGRFFHIASQLCSILGHLQKNDIIHYGIKPSNILFHPKTGQVKLMDAGMHLLHLKDDEDTFNPEVIRSCLAYVSPEQTGRINRAMDYRTDMYSLGITFYEMLTGTPPFLSDDPLNVIHGHLARPPLMPKDMADPVPDILVDITRKLLAKNAEDRYQNALGLLADLTHCQQAFQAREPMAPFPLGQKDVAIRFTQSQVLVGRDKDVTTILNFITTDSDKSRVLTVTGPPGIGKTALIYEINKPVLERQGFFIPGKYEQFKRDVPYSAIIQALTDLMKQISSESREKFERWKHLIQKTLGANGRIITHLIPASKMIIGPQPPLPMLDPEAEKNRFNLVFLDFIRLFAHKEHPLILFLDDLQWADLPSIHLVKTMMSDPMIRSFYVIGSYRDKDVAPGDALATMLDDLKQSGCPVSHLALGPIRAEDIDRIISEQFKIPPGQGMELAQLLHRKTLGNPFFVNQCLKTLYEQGLISLDPMSGFHWDMHRLSSIQITENVVDLLSEKIMGLPRPIQEILKIGACIGNRFELPMVSQMIGKPPGDILRSLTAAMDQGSLIQKNNMYVFTHDRIQEAAYTLIPEDERPGLHYRIGMLELKHTPDDDLGNKLFYITEHLNRGMDLVKGEDEKLRLISMNLSCAIKAKQSTAYSSAASYIDKSLQLVTPSYWQYHFDLMSDLHMERLELNFYMGHFDKVYRYSNELLQRITSVEDKIRVCKIKALAYNSENRFQDTLDVLDYVQNLLGLTVIKKPRAIHFLWEYLKLRIRQAFRRVETWDQLPPMTDPALLSFCNFESVTNTAVYFTDRDLLIHHSLSLSQRIFKHGVSPELPYYLTGLGFILIAGFNQNDLGYRFGKSGIRLLEKASSPRYLASSYHIFNGLIRHWKEPLKNYLEDFRANYHRALATGDLFFAAYSLWYYMAAHFRTGTNLFELHKNMETYSQAMAKLHQIPAMIEFNLLWACMMGLTGTEPGQVEGYRHLSNLSNCRDNDELPDTHSVKPMSYYYQAFLNMIHHRYHETKDAIDKCLGHKDGLIGVFLIRDIAYFQAVTLLALLPGTARLERRQYLKTIRRNLKKLTFWSRHAPENTLHMVSLVRAEYAFYKKQTKKAGQLYEQAVAQALKYGYIQDQAFALEKAAVFYREQGNSDKASQCIGDAAGCYRKWGAEARLKALEARYPECFTRTQTHENAPVIHGRAARLSSLNESPSDQKRNLDVWSILKVSRALSEEIVLENLLSKLMTLVIESAGAQRGCIIFDHEGILSIEAEKVAGSDTIRLESRPIESEKSVSSTVINLTARSRDAMIVDDAMTDMSLSHDPYIRTFRPKAILCVPMVKKGRLSALLYLENNESAGAFTPVRVDVVQLLAQQAVVSIENAKLYRDVSRSEEKYRTILESIEDGYYELDLQGNCTFANTALGEMLGYSKEEVLKLNINHVMSPTDAIEAREIYRRVRESGTPRKGFEQRIYKKDGKLLFVEGSVSLISSMDGKPLGYRGLLRDITQKKDSEKLRIERDVAKKASHAKSMFLANMSHEIRTPMNAILGFASLLKERVADGQEQEFLDTIMSSGRLLMTLINDILDLSKIEAGKITIRNAAICPSAILNDLKQTFIHKAREKGNTLTVNVDEALPRHVIMDELRVRQILMNLTGNACKFTENGAITLHLRGQSRKAHVDLDFSVSDTGIGIAPDQHTRIFRTFEQTQDHNTAKYGGTGLGLALSRKLAQAMGGELTVQSEPGVGSTFTASFRNIPTTEKVHETPEPSDVSSSVRFEPATLLIVDDNRANRHMIENYLNGQPFILIQAETGTEAVEKAARHQPDLILMDLFLPEMNGFEAAAAIKQRHPDLPVFAVTASVMKNEEDLANASGCSGLLRKPLEKDALIRALSGILPCSYDDAATIEPAGENHNRQISVPPLSPETLARIPELLTLLEDEMNGPWNDIKEIFVTEQIQAFTDRIIDLGNQYSQEALVHWASAVKTHTSNIDMEKTFQHMEQFPDIINRIAQKAL